MFSALKGKRLYSILNSKCPVCHEGDYYLTKNPYNLKMFSKNHERCAVCNHKFEVETGFFYGAMYVSYALQIAFSVAIFIAIGVLFPSANYPTYIFSIIGGIIVLMPITYRFSRMIWMNLFISYQGKKSFR